MIRQIQDLESFEFVLDRLFKEVDNSDLDSFNLHELGEKIGLNDGEIEAMDFHLKRSDIIEKAGNSLVRISTYGQMMKSGKINQGYLPV